MNPRPGAAERPCCLCYNASRGVLVTADKRPLLWAQTRKAGAAAAAAAEAACPLGHKHALVGALYNAHFHLVVSADSGGAVCVWDVRSGARRFRFEHGGARITSMAFDRSGRRLITGMYTPILFHLSAIFSFRARGRADYFDDVRPLGPPAHHGYVYAYIVEYV